MIAAPHDISNQLITDIETYLDPSAILLVGMETAEGTHLETNGEHYHIVAGMTEKVYDKFRKTILVNKMNLRGRATANHSRQYGRVKNILDETKMMQYTCKDKNIYYRNIDLKKIQELLEKSYSKPLHWLDFYKKLMKHLVSQEHKFFLPGITDEIQYEQIEMAALEFFIKEHRKDEKKLNRAQLKSYVQNYLMYYSSRDIGEIYRYFFQR